MCHVRGWKRVRVLKKKFKRPDFNSNSTQSKSPAMHLSVGSFLIIVQQPAVPAHGLAQATPQTLDGHQPRVRRSGLGCQAFALRRKLPFLLSHLVFSPAAACLSCALLWSASHSCSLLFPSHLLYVFLCSQSFHSLHSFLLSGFFLLTPCYLFAFCVFMS